MSKIFLCGPACSGKSYFRDYLKSQGYKIDVNYTTRNKRKNEVNGQDYHFISENEFKMMLKYGLFYEYTCFNGWYYGTTKESWETSTVFIKTPEFFHSGTNISFFIIYFNISEETRKKRLNARMDDADSNERRLQADKKQFANFKIFNIEVTDENFDAKELLDKIKQLTKIDKATEVTFDDIYPFGMENDYSKIL